MPTIHFLLAGLLTLSACEARTPAAEPVTEHAEVPMPVVAPDSVAAPADLTDTQAVTAPTAPSGTSTKAVPATVVASELPTAFDHALWNTLLQAHVSTAGHVDYRAFAKDARFNSYLGQLSAAKGVNTWPRNERLAFWINAYNAFTIKLIADHPGVKSIKDIPSPWKQSFFSIGGEAMDLDRIEHTELRKNLGEPRIHFAIVCASFSCPQLWNRAFTAEGVSKQLDDAARRFINDPQRNAITGNAVRLSKIFDWFEDDFTKDGTLIAFLNKYASAPIPVNADVDHLDYDWQLNGTW